MIHYISAEHLTIARVEEILTNGYKLMLSDDAKHRINHCREYLDRKMEDTQNPIFAVQYIGRQRESVATTKEPYDVARLRHGTACPLGDSTTYAYA